MKDLADLYWDKMVYNSVFKVVEGHDFTKISHQPFATCNDCKAQIQFRDNPNAHKEMMTHECGETEPTENQKFYRRI